MNRQRQVRADWSDLRAFLFKVQSHVARKPFSVCLVSDRAIRRYNRQYRHQDKPTDVLSFRVENDPEYLGDIVISVETAQENAANYRLKLNDEIKILALHGVLHLMGYDHESDRGEMSRVERLWSSRMGLAAGLTARTRASRALLSAGGRY
ncbi:MAG: rRNA maturation RNase YbeY [Acidobacteria bacterium]|nr:rRNA maturation RNase YbeY [Acidobacteriota bacterium]